MTIEEQYISNVEAILSHRYDNGGDLWTTLDKRLLKGAPFSTIESVFYLLELGMDPNEKMLKDAADLIFSTWEKMAVSRCIQREVFTRAKQPSQLATKRYYDILSNLEK